MMAETTASLCFGHILRAWPKLFGFGQTTVDRMLTEGP
jgi:hypothetical protein